MRQRISICRRNFLQNLPNSSETSFRHTDCDSRCSESILHPLSIIPQKLSDYLNFSRQKKCHTCNNRGWTSSPTEVCPEIKDLICFHISPTLSLTFLPLTERLLIGRSPV
ncbi:hypothetical protein CEXT_799471 [Caerostris extrusa]|uniref:Uncharacterized protein n=1 Tax=Caerostris extrusa TaxID=172846 RepID=A0AAV4XPH9_CAEEX|nr:hypothetical protein CEXT_799471 [Caerostris extrusa]